MSILDDLIMLEPTESENVSVAIYSELLWQRPDWRTYSSRRDPTVTALVQRFVTIHAAVPGLLTDTMPSTRPLSVLHCAIDGGELGDLIVHGGVWTNGAALHVEPASDPPWWILMVDEEVCQRWVYPEGYQYVSRVLAAQSNEADKNKTDSSDDDASSSSSTS